MSEAVGQLEWAELTPPGAAALVARHGDFPAASQIHTHDFAEVFVVESGSASHDRDGREHPLKPGDLVFILPETVHRFVTPTTDFRITNVAFPASFLTAIREMILEADEVWSGQMSHPIGLDPAQRIRILRMTDELAKSDTRLILLRLLVEILLSARTAAHPPGQPAWAQEALERWQNDEVAIRQGVTGLAAIAGRSREHVSRTLGAATGQRAIDVINNTRLELAANLLQTTDENISRIALRVGFSSLSHFYRLFKGRFGQTPGMFRRVRQAVVDPKV